MKGVSKFTNEDSAHVEGSLKRLIFAIATSLNADDTPELKAQIDEMIEFEKKLDEVTESLCYVVRTMMGTMSLFHHEVDLAMIYQFIEP